MINYIFIFANLTSPSKITVFSRDVNDVKFILHRSFIYLLAVLEFSIISHDLHQQMEFVNELQVFVCWLKVETESSFLKEDHVTWGLQNGCQTNPVGRVCVSYHSICINLKKEECFMFIFLKLCGEEWCKLTLIIEKTEAEICETVEFISRQILCSISNTSQHFFIIISLLETFLVMLKWKPWMCFQISHFWTISWPALHRPTDSLGFCATKWK